MNKKMKLTKPARGQLLYIFNASIIYILVLVVALNVPFQSDDYSYVQMGLSWEAHVKHYLDWSGRFITDYLSSLLLNLFSRPVYMAINTVVFLVVIMIISLLPYILRRKKIDGNASIILWIVFMLYWTSNPNLGQTSFWLVGSTNYMWTLMWASIYFAYLLYLDREPFKHYLVFALIILSFLSGSSNEGLGISSVLFSSIMLFEHRKKENKLYYLCSLISTCIGYAFVFFSPGNSARLNNSAFEKWRGLSIAEKFLNHFFDRMPKSFGRMYLIYIVLIYIFFSILWEQRSGEKIDAEVYSFSLIYGIISVFSIVVFMASPSMPMRSENTSLFFALLSLTFILNILIEKKLTLVGFLTIFCGMYFILSYPFVLHAYAQTNIQAEIRESIIREEKKNGNDTALIPDWYFTRLAKDADKFDLYRSHAMPSYYGLDEIIWKDVTFNYAVIKNVDPISVNKQLKDGLMLNNMYIRFDSPFEQTFVFEFDHPLTEFALKGDKIFYVHLKIDGRDGFLNEDLKLTDYIQFGEKYYYGRTIFTPNINELSTIECGLYNPDEKTNSLEWKVDLKKYD